jgi:alpha-1,3/alpha-1,6-mannosyltransferase
MMTGNQRLHIGFLHPDLGLGGAERLMVDAALCLQAAGHRVTIFTSHHDRTRCFEETRNGSLNVRVYGDFLPSHVGQRLRAPCTLLRMLYLTCRMLLSGACCDVIFCDLVAHTLPLVRRLSRAKILFYCHFPDQLLTPQRHGWYRFYRLPIDRLEAFGTRMADRVLVNSQFTGAMFRQTFPMLHTVPMEVLYPGIDCALYGPSDAVPETMEDTVMILSLNRYERHKNLSLAMMAFALLREHVSSAVFAHLQFVIAGGYDARFAEHRQTFLALQALARQLGLEQQVRFIRSCTEAERLALLAHCRCVVYTPSHEHFGFVPLEAMAAGRPVVAVASGGPLETVQHEITGVLCDPTPQAFAQALARLVTDPVHAACMGQTGRHHVAQHFARAVFGVRLERMVQELVPPRVHEV